MRRLLIIYHTQSGNTGRMAEQAYQGACSESGIETIYKRAFDAGIDDLLACHGLLIGTPENFGYMSGAIKDFFDRTYDAAKDKTVGLPYALFISAGNDGTGAAREIGRIATGYGWKQVAEPLIARKEITGGILDGCKALGGTLAAGIALGIF